MKRISKYFEDIEGTLPVVVPPVTSTIPPVISTVEPSEHTPEPPESHESTENIGDSNLIILLKKALAEEFLAWYQYIICHEFLHGNERTSIEDFYLEAAKDEYEDHGMWLMKRINELGGNLNDFYEGPQKWNELATHKYITPADGVRESLEKNIKAEEGAIETYTEIEQITRGSDPVTNRKIKEILADEEEHLQTLKDFLKDIS